MRQCGNVLKHDRKDFKRRRRRRRNTGYHLNTCTLFPQCFDISKSNPISHSDICIRFCAKVNLLEAEKLHKNTSCRFRLACTDCAS